MSTEIRIDTAILNANDAIATTIRQTLAQHKVLCLNFLGSPGSGKTSLVEALIKKTAGKYRLGVIEGDLETDRDAKRVQALGVQAVQIMTREYKSSCHMNALMVFNSLPQFDLTKLDILIVENVGNLVCPAEFDLGEDAKVVVLSTTEGEDKPLKYPVIFLRSQAAVINKVDLAQILETNLPLIHENIHEVSPNAAIFEVSATKDKGLDAFIKWIDKKMEDKKAQ